MTNPPADDGLTGPGDFDFRVMASATRTDPSLLFTDRSLHGLELEGTYLYGTFRDEEGTLYTPMRRIPLRTPGPPRKLTMHTSAAGTLTFDRVGGSTAASESVQRRVEGEGYDSVLTLSAADGQPTLTSVVSATEGLWREGDLIDVSGTNVGPTLQWYLPDPEGGMYYCSQLYTVRGTIAERSVTGFFGIDEMFQPAGVRTYIDDSLTRHHIARTWVTFGNWYADGSAEVGHAAIGRGSFRFGLGAGTDGHILATEDVTSDASISLPARALPDFDIAVAGERWTYTGDPAGLYADTSNGPIVRGEGCLRRCGDDRELVAWFCATELTTGDLR